MSTDPQLDEIEQYNREAELLDQAEPGQERITRHDGDCPATCRDTAFWRYFCTRDADHTGQHVAEGDHSVIACWNDGGRPEFASHR